MPQIDFDPHALRRELRIGNTNPGDTYIYGLIALAEKNQIPLPAAYTIADRDLDKTKSWGEQFALGQAYDYLNPGALYIEGLKRISLHKTHSLEKAAELAIDDANSVKGLEHLPAISQAYFWLTGKHLSSGE